MYPMGRGSPGHVTLQLCKGRSARVGLLAPRFPSLGEGTAPPPLSHRGTLPFCVRRTQPPAASSLEGEGPALRRFLLPGLGQGSGGAELKGVSCPAWSDWTCLLVAARVYHPLPRCGEVWLS